MPTFGGPRSARYEDQTIAVGLRSVVDDLTQTGRSLRPGDSTATNTPSYPMANQPYQVAVPARQAANRSTRSGKHGSTKHSGSNRSEPLTWLA